MFGLFKKRGGGSKEPVADPATDYQGYRIIPAPREGSGGWSTEATITKVIDGEEKSHHFIRADKSGSRDGAVELTLNKCRQTIDQLGDRIFS